MKKELQVLRNNQGFTLLEILLVVLLLAILAAIGITSFVGSSDTKNSATKEDLSILRKGIAAVYAIEQMDCGVSSATAWPPVACINANDITSAAAGCASPCSTAQVPNGNDRKFALNGIPGNPWQSATDTVTATTLTACVAADQAGHAGNNGTAKLSCLPSAGVDCAGSVWGTVASEGGWCYDPTSGQIWANTNNNNSAGGSLEYEF